VKISLAVSASTPVVAGGDAKLGSERIMSSLSAGPAQAASKIAANKERPEFRVTVAHVTPVKLCFIDECTPSQLLYSVASAIEPEKHVKFPKHAFTVLYVDFVRTVKQCPVNAME
jgi:hypothetical protein